MNKNDSRIKSIEEELQYLKIKIENLERELNYLKTLPNTPPDYPEPKTWKHVGPPPPTPMWHETTPVWYEDPFNVPGLPRPPYRVGDFPLISDRTYIGDVFPDPNKVTCKSDF